MLEGDEETTQLIPGEKQFKVKGIVSERPYIMFEKQKSSSMTEVWEAREDSNMR